MLVEDEAATAWNTRTSDKRVEELEDRLWNFITRVGDNYVELSHDKVRDEYLYFKMKARKLLKAKTELESVVIDESKSKCDTYDILVNQLFELLDKTEESMNGSVFHPNVINSCRVEDTRKLDDILLALKLTLGDTG